MHGAVVVANEWRNRGDNNCYEEDLVLNANYACEHGHNVGTGILVSRAFWSWEAEACGHTAHCISHKFELNLFQTVREEQCERCTSQARSLMLALYWHNRSVTILSHASSYSRRHAGTLVPLQGTKCQHPSPISPEFSTWIAIPIATVRLVHAVLLLGNYGPARCLLWLYQANVTLVGLATKPCFCTI